MSSQLGTVPDPSGGGGDLRRRRNLIPQGMHARLRSLSLWFENISSPLTNTYAFTPLPTSTTHSPDLGAYGKQHAAAIQQASAAAAGGAFHHNQRSLLQRWMSVLVALWTWTSPFILVAVYLTCKKPPRVDTSGGILNPYVCERPSVYSSLEQMCLTAPKDDRWNSQLEGYELGLDRHLTDDQCDDVFPGLYNEVDRAVKFWSEQGGVKLADLDAAEEKGQARAMIINNRLYVKSYSGEQQGTRTKATLASINEALITSREPIPDIEFVVMTGDTGLVAGAPWVLGRKEEEEALTLMPDYGFFSWPEPAVNSFLEVQDNCLEYESHQRWKDKIPKLFWRGAMMVDIRKELYDVAKKFKWGAVADIDWGDKDALMQTLLTPEQHCMYKYLGHVEGWAYSGRLKYLLQCRSVIVAHKMEYLQHFHHLFNDDWNSPQQNMALLVVGVDQLLLAQIIPQVVRGADVSTNVVPKPHQLQLFHTAQTYSSLNQVDDMFATQPSAPLSAASKTFEAVEWCLENRRPKRSNAASQPVLCLGNDTSKFCHPDEEKGRKYRAPIARSSSTDQQWELTAATVGKLNDNGRAPVSGFDTIDVVGDDEDDDSWINGLSGSTNSLSLKDSFLSHGFQVEMERLLPGQTTVKLDNWHSAVDHAVERAEDFIDMSGQDVADIPSCVADLEKIRKLPTLTGHNVFGRTQSGPLMFGSKDSAPRRRTFARTSSGSLTHSVDPVSTAVMLRMNLNNNNITAASISPAFFRLTNLRTLYLRQNKLECVPPGFARLSGLVELSIAGNKIEFLPAELLNLRNLTRLTLHPNAFRPAPSTPASTLSGRLLADLVVNFNIPSLHEIAIRSFLSLHLSGHLDAARGREALACLPTHLEAPFENIDEQPSWFSSSQRRRHPSSASDISFQQSTSPASSTIATLPFDPLSNVCRSPAHDGQERVFFRPAVERMEWVSESYLVGGSAAGTRSIPILHRGCGRTCLDWLEYTPSE
ncbi:hypothetical protein OIO90_001340 [Microbotryomycetes sp. JL221]|nr:hypothetical protein OIO90_001340 [Microbotryomycetes sp. JL221]